MITGKCIKYQTLPYEEDISPLHHYLWHKIINKNTNFVKIVRPIERNLAETLFWNLLHIIRGDQHDNR